MLSSFKWLWWLVRFSCWLEKISVKSLQWNVMKQSSGPGVINLLLTSYLSLSFPLSFPFKKIETEFVSSSKFSGLRTWSVFRLIIIIDLWYPYIRMLTCQKKNWFYLYGTNWEHNVCYIHTVIGDEWTLFFLNML